MTLKCLLGYQGRAIVNELLLGDMSDMGVSEVGMEDFCHKKKCTKLTLILLVPVKLLTAWMHLKKLNIETTSKYLINTQQSIVEWVTLRTTFTLDILKFENFFYVEQIVFIVYSLKLSSNNS